MNINQLEWFCLAYEARSFAKAAEGAFVSRQALGKALAHLEGEVGAQLFERSEAGVAPTAAADAAYPIAQHIVADERALRRACAEAAQTEHPAIRIAIANGVLRSLSAGLLGRLEEAFPALDFFIEKHYFLECFDRLETGEVDFALCPAPREGSYQRWPVVEEDVFVAAADALIDFDPDTCTLEDLESLVFFLPGDRGPNDLGLGRAMAERGLTRRTNTQYTDYDFITEKVIAGQGAALAPESALAPFVEAGLTTFPVPEPTVRWRVELLARQRELTEVERQVIAFLTAPASR
ncbi:LysR family transcriptional regulator [Adlercreutzia caecimuris]|uniref:LysR family transcriptional regulator n=1 Tax=Adlercreutzia caecimuris TaxID=671266 RepID=UPI001C3CCA3D|nr:LysR family transcriptional regulator [Adlercreutzia caecimuris]MCR2037993.1 LysR family transcriptional regulator [Adlercreutzia caecimuris]